MINLISIRSGPYKNERGPTKVQALRKAELSVKPEENVGISGNVRVPYVLRPQQSTKKTLDVDNPDKILIRKVSQSI